MREYNATLTKKGQATIPAEVRRLLGIGPHDQITFVVEDGQVRVERKLSVVERTYGLLKSDLPPLSAEELRAAAEQAIADEVMERSGG